MTTELKPCPWCASKPVEPDGNKTHCTKRKCPAAHAWIEVEVWNTRPIEDDLNLMIKREALAWAEDHTHLQKLCREIGCTEFEVEGDSYGVPGIEDLANMLKARIDELETKANKLWQQCRVVYYSGDDDYPIEHNPFAAKNSRELIEAKLKEKL